MTSALIPEAGLLLVLANNGFQYREWLGRQKPDVAKRCTLLTSIRGVDGCRPAAVIELPNGRERFDGQWRQVEDFLRRAMAKTRDSVWIRVPS